MNTKTKTSMEGFTPHDLEAEKCLLGSVLLSPDAFYDVVGTVKADHFYSSAHRQVWKSMKLMYESGRTGIDAVLLIRELDKSGQLGVIGGESLVLEIAQTVPHAAHAQYYASLVTGCSIRREIITAGEEMIRSARSNQCDPQELSAHSEQKLFSISEGLHGGDVQPVGDLIDSTLQSIFDSLERTGIQSNFQSLDQYIRGFSKTHLTVLAARPAMGKTALACNIAMNAATAGNSVLFFSLEMSKLELTERLLLMRAGIERSVIAGAMTESQHRTVTKACQDLKTLPIRIDDVAGRTPSQLSAICRREKRRNGLGMVILDYIQLVEPDDSSLPREQQVSATARNLKRLAKDMDVPVLALSQLNRGVEGRDDKRPRMSDLRESGAIEQDADVVMLLHRPSAYDPDDRPGEADVIVAKNRHGGIGTAELVWKPQVMRFADKVRQLEF